MEQNFTENAKKRIPSLPALWEMYEPDSEKTARAKNVHFLSIAQPNEEITAECKGSHGEIYSVSLEKCTCVDFAKNKRTKPCKHMIALAMKCNALNENGLTFEQDTALTTFELAMKVAIASGFYHVYKMPIVSDQLYNALKYELWDFAGLVEEDDVTDLDITISAKERELLRAPLRDFELHVKRYIDALPSE